MSRRKTIIEEIIDVLSELSIVYIILLILFYFTNKPLFWKMLFGGLIFFGVLILMTLFIKKSKTHKQNQWKTDKEWERYLLGLEHWEFENFVADLFSKLGYKTQVIGGSYDEGIDIIAERDGAKHYIQCKHYHGTIGPDKIRDFYGAVNAKYSNEKAFFVTTSYFSEETSRFSKDKNIELIDRAKLIKLIRETEKN